VKYFAVAAIGFFVMAGFMGLAGARVNTTASYPVGLYWMEDTKPVKGSLVLFCPPRNAVFVEARARGYLGAGFCEAGTNPMIKRIVASKGDWVFIGPDYTAVNGAALANSAQAKADLSGRPLPDYQARLVMAEGQVLLMSDQNPRSFDARYFGPVDARQIRGALRPLLTLWR